MSKNNSTNKVKVTLSHNNQFVFHIEESKGHWDAFQTCANEWKARQFVTVMWENGEITKGRAGELLRGISNLVASLH